MTISQLEAERLVRKITDMLSGSGNVGLAPKFAEDYSALCNYANQRLHTCEDHVRSNNRIDAIQMAGMDPHLLSLVTALEFSLADEWREYCTDNQLPVADRIDENAVKALNACISSGAAVDHELYKLYKTAILKRDDDEALRVIREIHRINSSDTNAAKEIARLEGMMLADQLANLENALQTATPEVIQLKVEKIERTSFKVEPEGEVWRRAQAVRSECLLQEVATFERAALWMDAMAMLEFIVSLQEKYKLAFVGTKLQQFMDLDTWARAEQAKDLRQREFRSLLKDLTRQLNLSEEKDTAARAIPLPELKVDYENLHKVLRSLTDFTWPIPEEAAARFRKRTGLLESEIARRTAHQRRVAVITLAIVLVTGGALAAVFLGWTKARDYTNQLQASLTKQDFRATENLMDHLDRQKWVFHTAMLDVARGNAQSFLKQQTDLLANFDTAAAALDRGLTNEGDADSAAPNQASEKLVALSRDYSALSDSKDKLCPDLSAEKTPIVLQYSNRWQEYRFGASENAERALETMVDQAEPWEAKWIQGISLAQARTNLDQLAAQVSTIDDFQSRFNNQVKFDSVLVKRIEVLRNTVRQSQDDLKVFDATLQSLRQARDFNQYLPAMSALANSPFKMTPEQQAAWALNVSEIDEDKVQQALLGINLEQWNILKQDASPRFVPPSATPLEHAELSGLWNDPAISGSYSRIRCQLGNDAIAASEWIVDGDLDTKGQWSSVMAFETDVAADNAFFSQMDYFSDNNLMRIKWQGKTLTAVNFQVVEQLTKTAALRGVGLEDFSSSTTPRYGHSLLEVVDSIKKSQAGSPLFRAYLYAKLVEVMKLNSEDWGLGFCPQLVADAARLQKEIGGSIKPGDWFLPARASAAESRLDDFFKSVQGWSYVKQAQGIFELEKSVVNGGLVYAGYVGLSGQPVLVDTATEGDLWGYNLARKPVYLGTATAWVDKPLPYSPLFKLADTREQLLSKAGVNLNEAEFKDVLPPLFRKTIN